LSAGDVREGEVSKRRKRRESVQRRRVARERGGVIPSFGGEKGGQCGKRERGEKIKKMWKE